MKEYCFIINPNSRGGKNLRMRRSLVAWIEKNLDDPWVVLTESPGHAADLVRHAAERGFRRVVSVGGDGTLHEVVNGAMALPAKIRPEIGSVALGTGGDFARLLREAYPGPSGWEWLKRAQPMASDLGLCKISRNGKASRQEYFVNIADVGISGEVTRRVNASDKKWGALEYLKSTLAAGWSYRPPRVGIEGFTPEQGEVPENLDLFLLVVANGPYFGGGMCIAPGAKIDDGQFGVMLAEKAAYWRILKELPKLYLKRRLKHPKIYYGNATSLSISTLGPDLPLGMDGEFQYARRIEFQILPKALKILVPKPRDSKS